MEELLLDYLHQLADLAQDLVPEAREKLADATPQQLQVMLYCCNQAQHWLNNVLQAGGRSQRKGAG